MSLNVDSDPIEVINLMRTLKLSQIRKALEEYKKTFPDDYNELLRFFNLANRMPV